MVCPDTAGKLRTATSPGTKAVYRAFPSTDLPVREIEWNRVLFLEAIVSTRGEKWKRRLQHKENRISEDALAVSDWDRKSTD
jgi:hypothetical protein